MKTLFLRPIFKASCTLLGTLFLSSCSVHNIQESTPLNAHANWIVLPFINHSDSPEAGERVADISAALLRSEYKVHLLETRVPNDGPGIPELNQQKAVDTAIKWGKAQQYQYGLGGSVQEWHYKSGLDAEPAVGVTLNVINLNTGETIWTASGAKTGWGRESVSGTGQKLVAELLDGLSLTK